MTPAMYLPTRTPVEVIQDGDELAYVKFPTGKVLWVKSGDLDFDDIGDDDWGPENDDNLGFDSPTDFDEHEMNYDDCYEAGDPFDFEYDRP
jgi:hypothetical protein